MIIAAVQPWLRRSDQAVRWARNMLRPGHAVIVDTQAADLPGNLCEIAVLTSSPPYRTGIPSAWVQAAWWLTLPEVPGLPRPVAASPAAKMLCAALRSAFAV